MRNKTNLLLGVVLMTASSHADILKLKQGGGVQGVLVEANSREVVFMGPDGVETSYPIDALSGIEFRPLPPPTPPKPVAPQVLTIPAGTQITVRMLDAINGKTAQPGAQYRASIDEPVGVGSVIAIPRGATCIIEVVKIQSGEGMALRIREIELAGKIYRPSTAYADIAAQGTSKNTSAVKRGVGLGALGAGIGALAGGGKGAAIGALAGGTVGAVSAVGAKGKQINVPAESRLIFALQAPLPMN